MIMELKIKYLRNRHSEGVLCQEFSKYFPLMNTRFLFLSYKSYYFIYLHIVEYLDVFMIRNK